MKDQKQREKILTSVWTNTDVEKNMFGVWINVFGKNMFGLETNRCFCVNISIRGKKIFDQSIFLSHLGHTKSVAMLHDWYKYRARNLEQTDK